MRLSKWVLMACVAGIVLGGCGAKVRPLPESDGTEAASTLPNEAATDPSNEFSNEFGSPTCSPASNVDYFDFLKLNDITYYHEGANDIETDRLIGKQAGEVLFTMDNNACLGHRTVNGDAAYLPVGTKVFAMKGYKPDFRLIADGRIYQAVRNPNAKMVEDILDISGKVKAIIEENAEDGTDLGKLPSDQAKAFVGKVLKLAYIDPDQLVGKFGSAIRYFRVELTDGTKFRFAFGPESLGFSFGAVGTEEIGSLLSIEPSGLEPEAVQSSASPSDGNSRNDN